MRVPTRPIASPTVLQASSPDEEALVEGAALAGFRLRNRSTSQAGSICFVYCLGGEEGGGT
jgi:hypothetical protein